MNSMTVAFAAPHPLAVSAGEVVARSGGNAIDVALAAATMLTVVYPHQCAIGGDLIAVVRAPDGTTTAVVGAGSAPAGIGSVAAQWAKMPRRGPHAVTVPGMVAGWRGVAALGASRSLHDALANAADVAREGVAVSEGLARALADERRSVAADPGLSGVFSRGGRPLIAGEVFVQPALADTLDRLAGDPNDMYTGETARRLVRALRDAGGVHTGADFAACEPETLPALTVQAAGRSWSVAPPPSAGILVPAVVRAASECDEATPAALATASMRGVAARGAYLGDPHVAPIDLDGLLQLDAQRRGSARESRASGDTAAVVAVDDAGWAVSIVQSVYMTFGAGLMDPESGVILHNRGSAFSLDPSSPGRLMPGARPPHTLSPLIVDDGATVLAAGCQGGRAQPWILAQLLAAEQSLSLPLDELLARPRWVIGDVDLGFDRLTIVSEPGAPSSAEHAATTAGADAACFAGPADDAGHVQFARVDSEGVLTAASDPRADGRSAVVQNEAAEERP